MASWRDDASEQVDRDFQILIDAVLPLAERLRSRHRDMVPFGATMSADGEVAMVMPQAEADDDTIGLLLVLQEGARAQRDDLRAVALAVDVRVAGASDAIRVQLDHVEGTAIEVLAPYRRSRLLRRARFGALEASVRDPLIWGGPPA